MRAQGLPAMLLSLLLGCGSAESPVAAPTLPAPPAAVPTAASSPAGSSTGTCQAQVVIAFYTDSRCDPASQVGQRRYDTASTCFTWVAQGSAAQENSATRFQCYRDRLCYTQHPDSLTCAGGLATDKESRTDRCTKEPNGRLYSKIVSGTEGCPTAPPGFECPASLAGQGTHEIRVCTVG
jgi:hypothetical protein